MACFLQLLSFNCCNGQAKQCKALHGFSLRIPAKARPSLKSRFKNLSLNLKFIR